MSDRADDFYVLYLPIPPRLRRFVWTVVACLFAPVVAAALLLGASQPDPGAGVWTDTTIEEVTGVLAAAPYAVLFPDDPNSSPVLVVESGKHGARPRADAFHDQRVKLRGTMLRREGRTLMELLDSVDAISPIADAPAPKPRPLRQTALRGEIVDAKCWHGAMKPGDGRTHKACAVLCIRGGIPPVLISRDSDGRPQMHLLTSPDAGPLDDAALALLAEPVEIQGELADWGGLPVIRVRAAGIRSR